MESSIPQRAPRILHLDDNKSEGILVARELTKKNFLCDVNFIQTEEEYRSALAAGGFDLILSDYRMPGFDGDQALALRMTLRPEIPFIMVTGELGEDRAIETIKRGATDYVLKDNLQRLVPAIERALEESRNAMRRSQAEEQLRRQHEELSVVHRLAEAVSRAEDLNQIFDGMFEAIEICLGAKRASVLLFGNDGKMHFQAWRNLSNKYRQLVDGHSPWNQDTRDPQPISISDVSQDEHLAGLREGILAEGIHALAFIPLIYDQRLIGKFMVYYPAPHAFSSGEIQLMETIGSHVAFAIGRKQSEHNQAFLAAIVQSSEDAIISKDLEGTITSWNKSAERIFGYSASEIIGKSITTIVPADRLSEEAAIIACLNKGERIEHFETIRVTKDGRHFPVALTISPIFDHAGNVIGASKIAREISSEEMERQVARRTAALEHSLKSFEEFAHTVSHDLRAPLRSIGAYTNIVLENEPELSPDAQANLRRVLANVSGMRQLIEALLTFAKLGKQALNRGEIDMVELAASVAENCQKSEGDRTVSLVIGSLPNLSGDPLLIRQLLQNLISNAFKYTRTVQYPKIEIGAIRTKGEAIYYVKDNGIGFDPADQPELFRIFSRLPQDASFEGNGIGLANAQRIAELHGGRIWAEGAPQKGATFYFSFGSGSFKNEDEAQPHLSLSE